MQLVSLTTVRISFGRSFQSFFDFCQRLLQEFTRLGWRYEFFSQCPIAKPFKTTGNFVFALPVLLAPGGLVLWPANSWRTSGKHKQVLTDQ